MTSPFKHNQLDSVTEDQHHNRKHALESDRDHEGKISENKISYPATPLHSHKQKIKIKKRGETTTGERSLIEFIPEDSTIITVLDSAQNDKVSVSIGSTSQGDLEAHAVKTTGVHGAGVNTLENTGNKGIANGYAPLDASTLVDGDHLPTMSQTKKGGVPATGAPSGLFLRDDATWQAAGSGAGSISVVLIDPSPASVNLSNEGIIDWFATTEANPPRTLAYSVLHSKPLGGQMMLSFDGVCGAASGVSWGLASTTPTAPLRTTNAGDDTGYLLTNNPFFTYIGDTSGAVLTGFGFRFRVPARVTSQVLRIYTGTSYCIEITMTAHLTDGSVADVVNVYDQPATGNHPICYKVTFQSAEAGAELEIKILCTKRYGTYGYVCFWAATLAAS